MKKINQTQARAIVGGGLLSSLKKVLGVSTLLFVGQDPVVGTMIAGAGGTSRGIRAVSK